MRRIALLLLMISLLSCDSGQDDPQIRGRYLGTAISGEREYFIDVTLSEDGSGNISGAGSINVGNESGALTVVGTHVFPNAVLTFMDPGFADYNFNASVSEDATVLAGTINGSGFVNVPLTLSR